MARKALVEKTKKRQKLIDRNWAKRQDLKARAADMNLSEEERQTARIALNKMSPNTSPVRMRNRCALTGRPRGYLRKFKLSRLTFREMASYGLIPGIFKASW